MGKSQIIITILLFNLFFIAFIVAMLLFVRQYKLKKKEHVLLISEQHTEHQKDILAAQMEIQTQTMQHIGREIHDNIGQKLTLASLYAQQLTFENKVPESKQEIEKIVSIINQSLTELRELSKSLIDNGIDSQNIIKILEFECKKINELKIVTVHFSSNHKKMPLDYQSKIVLLRILQEGIQNSIKHASCKNITIQLQNKSQFLVLSIQDDGIGFTVDKKKSKGIGLINMKTRTEIIGGSYQLESNNNGTSITIKIPI